MELSQCILKASKCSTHSNKIITTGFKNSCHQVQSATNKLLLGNQLDIFGLQIKNFLQTSVALPVMYGKHTTTPKRKKKKNNLKNMIALIMIGESVLISHIQLIWEVHNCFQAQVFFLKMLHKDFLEIAIYQHLWPQWQNTRTESKSFSKASKLIRMDLMMLSFTWMDTNRKLMFKTYFLQVIMINLHFVELQTDQLGTCLQKKLLQSFMEAMQLLKVVNHLKH